MHHGAVRLDEAFALKTTTDTASAVN